MIGKVVKPGKGFGGLARYLLLGSKEKKPDTSRVAWTATRNLSTDDPNHAAALMKATAARSKKVKAPVYHMVISWRRDEFPTDAIMEQVADATCDDLGLGDYQRLYVAHDDTDHRHVHVVINRVHAETGVAWRMSHDFRRIEQSLYRQSLALGLQPVPGRHTSTLQSRLKTRRPTTPALRKAGREGGTAVPRWSVPAMAERQALLRLLVDTATSWQHLHDGLRPIGIALMPKGMGLVFRNSDGEMKLSDLGKGYRLSHLEERYGTAFQSAVQPGPIREPALLSRVGRTAVSAEREAGDTIAMQSALAEAELRVALAQSRLGLVAPEAAESALFVKELAAEAARQAPQISKSIPTSVRRRRRVIRRIRE